MGRYAIIATILAASTAAATAHQADQTPGSNPPATVKKPMILVGCVVADKANADRFTLSDPGSGVTYRLRGLNVFSYSGRRIRIVGGLYPSPNIAAQRGAIDPTKAAMAAMDATGTNATGLGNVQPLEFRIAQLRPLAGTCPPQ